MGLLLSATDLFGPIKKNTSLKWDFNAMTSEIGDKKKFEFKDIALKKIQTHFQLNCRAFILSAWIGCRTLVGCYKCP